MCVYSHLTHGLVLICTTCLIQAWESRADIKVRMLGWGNAHSHEQLLSFDHLASRLWYLRLQS